jgi:hypothetical protein
MNHHTYSVGDTITYQTFGGGQVRTVRVTDRDPEIKNGSPGFFGTMNDGATVWGYDDQIISVNT